MAKFCDYCGEEIKEYGLFHDDILEHEDYVVLIGKGVGDEGGIAIRTSYMHYKCIGEQILIDNEVKVDIWDDWHWDERDYYMDDYLGNFY